MLARTHTRARAHTRTHTAQEEHTHSSPAMTWPARHSYRGGSTVPEATSDKRATEPGGESGGPGSPGRHYQ